MPAFCIELRGCPPPQQSQGVQFHRRHSLHCKQSAVLCLAQGHFSRWAVKQELGYRVGYTRYTPFLFFKSDFLFVQWWHPFTATVCLAGPASVILCVFVPPPFLQNTTDSSSNSSQKFESALQPLESSPFPQRHKCTLGHRHDLHDPYRLPDHYLLDQVRGRRWCVR